MRCSRRGMLGAAAALLAGCSVLPQRPYPQRRDWPLEVSRPSDMPRASGSRTTLLLRAITAGPGLEERGLMTLQPDGSVRSDYYEQWVAPPALAVEAALRGWLIDSGRFAGVLAPGSRAPADQVLEVELATLSSGPDGARATLGCTLLDERAATVRVIRQFSVTGTAPLSSADPAARVAAMEAALAEAFGQVEPQLGRDGPG